MLNYIWQFKNGSLGSISIVELVSRSNVYVAWDRSIGDWIFYEGERTT